MARYTGPKCRLCRREGEKLFLKGSRCESQKCAILRKNYVPGIHGKNKFTKSSEYSKQLREKQKAKRIYGILEKQFSNYYQMAAKKTGETNIALMTILERRIDNVVYKAGLAESRGQAKQLISHGLVNLNGHKITVPSIIVNKDDKFEIKDKTKGSKLFEEIKKSKVSAPKWISADIKGLKGEITAMPDKSDFDTSINSQLIVEYYSK
ncbi:30S ribosomal protein S4 [Patescibacteria group bacterium]|nr:30S ribosomal protein S4 [Patescibacteria group bacterium]